MKEKAKLLSDEKEREREREREREKERERERILNRNGKEMWRKESFEMARSDQHRGMV